MRFLPIPLLLLSLLTACTSLYETGGDQRAEWSVVPVSAANGDADDIAPVATHAGLYFTSNRELADEELDRMYLLPAGAEHRADVRHVRASGTDIRAGALAFQFGDTPRLLCVECYRDDAIGDCDLVEGRLSSDGLTIEEMHLLDTAVNSIEWDHHPTLSADGATLVFASERYGGRGGSDLWMSTRRDGRWSTPVNLGARINTTGNEITPCLSPDGETLYFASDALPGRGGFDIHMAKRQGGGWSEPRPLGLPFNSNDDDIFFSGTLERDTVYLASNRPGGSGGFDILRVTRNVAPPPPPPPPKEKPLVLRVRARNSYTRAAIPAHVSISAADDRVLAEGTETVESRLDPSQSYTVTGELSGFMTGVETIRFDDTAEMTRLSRDEGTRMVVDHDLLLLPVVEEERKIYAFTVEFDFNLFNIRPEEERKLDSVVILLARYPQSTVVFSGHTDSVGTANYNIKLGYNRAREVSRYVLDWLREKGAVLRNTAEIRTFGETEPVAPNSTEEGRQRNRRVEIAIVRNR
ncbi:MAG: OmpA family protein [Bacteroidota bacterium]|jgi:outer membrane protein OmpA-like peptidoglycan-associated protein|nr:OmpA family protein [Bacteroidota bacterium]